MIINEFGYPTLRKVGKEAAVAAWTIVMHSISNPPFMKKVLNLLKNPPYIDEVEPRELAYLEDRIRVLEGKPQIYGTQFDWDENNLLSPLPIENLEKVNVSREKLGMFPIEKQTEIMRENARKEGEQPQKKYLLRVKEMEDWARKVGWITRKLSVPPTPSLTAVTILSKGMPAASPVPSETMMSETNGFSFAQHRASLLFIKLTGI